MNGHDVFVNDRGGGTGLAIKPLSRRATRRQRRTEDLDSYITMQGGIEGFEDDAIATATDHAGDLITAQAPEHMRVVGGRQEATHAGQGRGHIACQIGTHGHGQKRIGREVAAGLVPPIATGRHRFQLAATIGAAFEVVFEDLPRWLAKAVGQEIFDRVGVTVQTLHFHRSPMHRIRVHPCRLSVIRRCLPIAVRLP